MVAESSLFFLSTMRNPMRLCLDGVLERLREHLLAKVNERAQRIRQYDAVANLIKTGVKPLALAMGI